MEGNYKLYWNHGNIIDWRRRRFDAVEGHIEARG